MATMIWGLGVRAWGLGVICMVLACGRESVRIEEVRSPSGTAAAADPSLAVDQIGRASCRERVYLCV